MKRFLVCFILLIFSNTAFAIIETDEDVLNEKNETVFEEPVVLEEIIKKDEETLKSTVSKEDWSFFAPDGILNDKLTFKFEKGPIKENKVELLGFFGFSENMDKKDSDFDFKLLYLKLAMLGSLRSEKEKYVISFNLTPDTHENFFHSLPLDAYIISKRIPNHTLKIGNFRPALGYEGSQALFLIPLIYKSQSARKLSDIRKTGISIQGDYKYIDYYLEGFSSSTQYEEFFPGVEANLRADFKPLANLDKKYGNLKIGGGYQTGSRNSTDYNIVTAQAKYNRDKFWFLTEYALANGSNGGDGLNPLNRAGYNFTIGYLPTDKLEFILRYDVFDENTKINNAKITEYTAGLNYYLYKQCIVLMLNYTYFQNEASYDSHRFIIGGQILI